MESCPHCHFLMRDDAIECGVCHRPRIIVVRDNVAIVDDARVGVGHSTGIPVAVVAMLLLVLAIGAGVGVLAVTQHWI
ncbi:hypothetical protein [Dermatobacter hominis]|uniref:hypothetical protein n=1 Tax=Dermatobacter hominis TaxID=2884263 RepID=UPI001D11C062|nr:hypothetical protein [Dermatobacter hominis]UDY35515.1 hypothetical protein LH044_19560 [Dermatobacter hominis]